jgi:hypothetical protein
VRELGATAFGGAALLGLSLILGGCGGGGGSSGGGTDYTPGDGPGTAALTWTAPSEREDGRSIAADDLGGYRIHFGPAADPEQYVIEVTDSGSSQYTISGLAPDTWVFAVSAFDITGEESSYSNSMTKVIVN